MGGGGRGGDPNKSGSLGNFLKKIKWGGGVARDPKVVLSCQAVHN